MGLRARRSYEKQALLFARVYVAMGVGRLRSYDHALGRWAALPLWIARQAGRHKTRHMHGFELEPLAAVDRHQPHGIHMECIRGDLPEVALFGEEDKLAHAIGRILRPAEEEGKP